MQKLLFLLLVSTLCAIKASLAAVANYSLPIAQPGGLCGAGIARCAANECCSCDGVCGISSKHCGSGCKPEFGKCGGGDISSNTDGSATISISSAGGGETKLPVTTDSGAGEETLTRSRFRHTTTSNSATRPPTTLTAPRTSTVQTTPTERINSQTQTGSKGDPTSAPSTNPLSRPGTTTRTSVPPTPSSSSLPIAPSGGRCGANIATCPGSECCSVFNYCGLTNQHCGTGCQSGFGACGLIPFNPRVIRNCVEPKMAALTFDDGPSEFTDRLLDVLRNAAVKATFFVQGVQIRDRGGASLQRAVNEGHQIASHSDTHPSFLTLNNQQILDQLTRAEAEIVKAIRRRPRYFRFPYGDHNSATDTVVLGQGYTIVDWNLDTNDWQVRNTAQIIQNLRSGMRELVGQSIIALTHDTVVETVNAATQMIDALRSAGYRLVTVAECNGDPDSAYR